MPAPAPRFRDVSRAPTSRWRVVRVLLGLMFLLAIGAGAAYWAFQDRIRIDQSGVHLLPQDTSVRRIAWTTPQSLGDKVNTDQQEYEPCVASDGTELFFVRGRTGGNAHIFYSQRVDGGWSTPAPLEAVNGPTDDLGPRLSADGRFLYFYSDRPGGFGGYDIWAVERHTDRTWGKPFNLGSAINSEFNEYSPDPTPDGRHLIFATNRTAATREQSESWHATIRQTNTSDYDLWLAELQSAAVVQDNSPGGASVSPLVYAPSHEIAGINSQYAEGGSCMSPAGDFLYFSSNRPGGYGKFDLYRCPVHDWVFGRVENLGPTINTADNEMDPLAALGGYRLYFDSDRPGSRGGYDLYSSESREVVAGDWLRFLPHRLPRVTTSGLIMGGSLLAMIPLVLLLRRQRSRLSILQLCLILSILFHVLLSFGLSFVMVSQQVRQYVKNETGIDLALSLPRSIELALSLRNPSSSEGPQATAPPELDSAPLPVEVEHGSASVSLGTPLAAAEPAPATPAPADPRLDRPPAPLEQASPSTPTPRPSFQPTPTPAATPLHVAEAEPVLGAAPLPSAPLTAAESPSVHPQIVIAAPQVPMASPRISVGPDAPPAPDPTLSSPAADNPWQSIGEADPVAAAAPAVGSGPQVQVRSPSAATARPRPSSATADAHGSGSDAGEPNMSDGPLASSAAASPRPAGLDLPKSSASAPPATGAGAPLEGDAPLSVPLALVPQTPSSVTPPAVTAAIPPPALLLQPRLIPVPTPFHRAPEERKVLIDRFGGTPQSEEAVARGLAYLARVQEADGRWTLMQTEQAPGKQRFGPHDMAYTGLALLAFLAQNHTADSPDLYHDVVRRGLTYLMDNQSSDGDLRGPAEFRGASSGQANMYDHAIATLAVSEAALLTHDPRATAAAHAAAGFILRAQDQQGGGWRYGPDQQGDSSVFGWQIMALHSVELLGDFHIPPESRRRAQHYIDDSVSGARQGLCGYQPGVSPTPTMTAEMIFARLLLGEHFSAGTIDEATRFLADHPVNPAEPDLYYWYYASMSMIQLQPPIWDQWNVRTRDTLIRLQHRGGFGDGAWEVRSKRVDRAGYIFTTAIATLTLEVYYRYAPSRDLPPQK